MNNITEQKWTIEELKDAIDKSKKWKDVCSFLGLVPGDSRTNQRLKRIAQKHGINYSHFNWNKKYSKKELMDVIPHCRSMRQVLLELGMNETGSAYATIKRTIKEIGIDTSHFSGNAWNKGNYGKPTNKPKPLEEVMVENSSYTNFTRLKQRLIRDGLLENICSICGQKPVWNGEALILELDHINGIKKDNRLENLRIVCPHCHSQTDTYCGKNIK